MLLSAPNSTASRCANFPRDANSWRPVVRRSSRRCQHCVDICLGYCKVLSTYTFHFVAQFGQFGLYLITVIALYFDGAVFDGTAGAAEFLELLSEGGQNLITGGYSGDDGDGFSAAMLAVSRDADNAISLFCWCFAGGLVTATMFVWLSTNGTVSDSPAIRGVDETIWHA